MEWLLQVVDEIDDAVGAMKLGWLGVNAEIGALLAVAVAATAIGAAFALGQDVIAAGTAALVGSLFAVAIVRDRRVRPRP